MALGLIAREACWQAPLARHAANVSGGASCLQRLLEWDQGTQVFMSSHRGSNLVAMKGFARCALWTQQLANICARDGDWGMAFPGIVRALFDRDRAPRLTRRGGGGLALTRRTGGGGGVVNEAHGGGLALTRRAGGLGVANEARAGGFGANEARGGGGLALTRRAGGFGANEARAGGNPRANEARGGVWRYIHKAVHTKGGLQPPQEACYLRGHRQGGTHRRRCTQKAVHTKGGL